MEFTKWMLKGLFWLTIILVGLAVVSSAISLMMAYITKPAQMLDIDNVERQVAIFASRHRSLEASVANLSNLKTRLAQFEASNPDRDNWNISQRDQHTSMLNALSAATMSYNRECGAYQAGWDNTFQSLPVSTAETIGLKSRAPRDCPYIK